MANLSGTKLIKKYKIGEAKKELTRKEKKGANRKACPRSMEGRIMGEATMGSLAGGGVRRGRKKQRGVETEEIRGRNDQCRLVGKKKEGLPRREGGQCKA